MPRDLDQLISRISKLDINQQRIISELVDELAEDSKNGGTRGHTIAPNTGARARPRVPNYNFVSKDGTPLAVGDRVQIQTSRKTGKYGDIAEVTQFNKSYVAITILDTGASTQRASKYLQFLE